ncbi:MAG: VanZ family protein [Nocardioidaceae bacterium]|nr:VanZ family protein [Nocardioidaceae bacterium]
MITTVLIEHPWLVPLLFFAAVGVGIAAGAAVAPRPRLAWILTALSASPVVLLTLWPSGTTAFPGCEVAWSVPSFAAVESGANVALFVVPVLLAAVAMRRPVLAFVGGSVASAAIELVQSTVTVLGRSCSTNDWLWNTSGAAIGALLALVVLSLARRRHRSRSPGRGTAAY